MNEQKERELAEQLAAPIIKDNEALLKAKKRFKGRRNRSAWMRMNRPSKMTKMERGATLMMNFLDRNIHRDCVYGEGGGSPVKPKHECEGAGEV